MLCLQIALRLLQVQYSVALRCELLVLVLDGVNLAGIVLLQLVEPSSEHKHERSDWANERDARGKDEPE